MMKKREILFLAHRIPYPPNKGDKIRSWRLFKWLAERFDVHLACFVDDAKDLQYEDKLREMVKSAVFIPLNKNTATLKSAACFLSNDPASLLFYRDARMQKAVEAICQLPLAAEIVFSSPMAQYFSPRGNGAVRIVDFCDCDAEKWRQYAQNSHFPTRALLSREARLLADFETHIANTADASFAITPGEAALFNARPALQSSVDWWANGVDSQYFRPDQKLQTPANAGDIVFVGMMDYRPNIEGVLYFARQVWPLIRDCVPSATFSIVGANPVNKIKALSGVPGINVTGRVNDVRAYLQNAKVIAAPLQIGRGIQNKVLEAMAMARPIVATTGAAEGVHAVNGKNMIICDDAFAMANAFIKILHNPQEGARIGACARQTILSEFQWDANLQRFGRTLDEAIYGVSRGVSSSSGAQPASLKAPDAPLKRALAAAG